MKRQKSSPGWTLSVIPTPAKALATCVIITLSIAMAGALGQIYVHDIVPTFIETHNTKKDHTAGGKSGIMTNEDDHPAMSKSGRGDLFSDLKEEKAAPESLPIYKNEQFVWTLKWTHIHLFGINMIFILMGVITLLLDISIKSRTWLVVLPFIGIITDISAMWLKGFVSPAFFWLHVPGGSVFGAIFVYVSARALWEMWGKTGRRPSTLQNSKGQR